MLEVGLAGANGCGVWAYTNTVPKILIPKYGFISDISVTYDHMHLRT